MVKSEIEREIRINEEDKKASEHELEMLKENYAKNIVGNIRKAELNGYYYKPIKYRKPFYIRFGEFLNKIKYTLGL